MNKCLCFIFSFIGIFILTNPAFSQNEPSKTEASKNQGKDTLLINKVAGLPPIEKPTVPPQLMPPALLPGHYTYLEKQLPPLVLPVSLPPLPKPEMPAPTWEKLYPRQLTLGYGRFNTPTLKLNLSNGRNNVLGYDFSADHISSTGHIDNADFTNTQLTGNAKLFTRDVTFFTHAYFQNKGYRFYGIETPTADYGIGAYHAVKRMEAQIGIATNVLPSRIEFESAFTMRYFTSNFGNNEFHAIVDFSATVPIAKIGLELYAAGKGILGNINIDVSSVTHRTSKITGLGEATFTLRVRKPFWFAELGATFSLSPDNVNGGLFNRNQIAPRIRIERNFGPGRPLLYFLYEGKIIYNTLYDLYAIYPYINPSDAFVTTTTQPIFAKSGVKLRLAKIQTDAFGYVKHQNNAPFFFSPPIVTAPTSNTEIKGLFNSFYLDRLTEYGLGLDLSYPFAAKGKLGLQMQGNWFVTYPNGNNTANIPYYGVPIGTARFFAHIPITWRLLVQMQLGIIGNRTFGVNLGDNENVQPTFTDLNIRADFSLSKRLDVWAAVNNALNRPYYRWNYYLERPLDIKVGFSARF